MPIKMKALRRYYAKGEQTEYAPGEQFNVADQREADRLVRMKRAEVVQRPAAETQTYRTRAETAAPTADAPKPAPTKPRRYNRRDLRAES